MKLAIILRHWTNADTLISESLPIFSPEAARILLNTSKLSTGQYFSSNMRYL